MAAAQYRPKFVFWTSLLAQMPFQLFFSVWAGVFFGGMFSTFTARSSGGHGQNMSAIAFVGIAVFCLFPVVTLTARWLNYRSTIYRVFADRIVVEEGFLTQHRKEIRISSIREISLRRGILQRLVGLGSVYVATQATGQGQRWPSSALMGGTSTFASGAMLMDLSNFESAYDALRGLFEGVEQTRDTADRT